VVVRIHSTAPNFLNGNFPGTSRLIYFALTLRVPRRGAKLHPSLLDRKPGTSHRNKIVAAIPPANCATTKRGTSPGRIPANVSLKHLAIVTAGLAKEVDAVNQ
jgi:hypothetical protein